MACYFSAEFLYGPQLVVAWVNLGIEQEIRQAVAELGKNLDDLWLWRKRQAWVIGPVWILSPAILTPCDTSDPCGLATVSATNSVFFDRRFGRLAGGNYGQMVNATVIPGN